jgi:hypothetical protein
VQKQIVKALAQNDNLWEISGNMSVLLSTFGFPWDLPAQMQNNLRIMCGLEPHMTDIDL